MNPGESGKIISFVYLAGPTVQVRITAVSNCDSTCNIFLKNIRLIECAVVNRKSSRSDNRTWRQENNQASNFTIRLSM